MAIGRLAKTDAFGPGLLAQTRTGTGLEVGGGFVGNGPEWTLGDLLVGCAGSSDEKRWVDGQLGILAEIGRFPGFQGAQAPESDGLRSGSGWAQCRFRPAPGEGADGAASQIPRKTLGHDV